MKTFLVAAGLVLALAGTAAVGLDDLGVVEQPLELRGEAGHAVAAGERQPGVADCRQAIRSRRGSVSQAPPRDTNCA